jgi:S-adenosylmethionine hydrolase
MPVVRTYGELAPGTVGILASSFGLLEVAERDGSASLRLGVSVGDRVELAWTPPTGKGGK